LTPATSRYSRCHSGSSYSSSLPPPPPPCSNCVSQSQSCPRASSTFLVCCAHFITSDICSSIEDSVSN
jgi:hypothetical protein